MEALNTLASEKDVFLDDDGLFNPTVVYKALKNTNTVKWLPVIFAEIKSKLQLHSTWIFFYYDNLKLMCKI